MRWSGLRIRDAITLERHRLHGDSLLLYQAKTGTPVYVPLPEFVVEDLVNVPPGPKPNPRYFFWSGNGHPKSAVADWQRSYRRLFELANITRPDGEKKRCHPHMLRDTFAVEMLLAGVPIDQVFSDVAGQPRPIRSLPISSSRFCRSGMALAAKRASG